MRGGGLKNQDFLLLLILAAAAPLATAQTWSYQGNTSCYSYGGNTQCYGTGTLQRYATNREHFESQFRAGQAVGEGVGLLLRAWIERRGQLELERKDTRQ